MRKAAEKEIKKKANAPLQDNKDAITLKGKQIAIALRFIRLHCCHVGPRENDAISGQQFTPWGWTANAGYGNCNDPTNIRPHM